MRETVLVLDFGSQYCQLIARRVRSLGVYCEILPQSVGWEEVERRSPRAVIFSGGPASVLDEGAPQVDERMLCAGIPILGICYGMQLLGARLGGTVQKADSREYGPAVVEVDRHEGLFEGFADTLDVWMSHGDQVERLPEGFVALAHSATCPVAAMGNEEKGIYGVQFHPEVVHTPRGIEVFRNFLFGVAGCEGGWSMRSFVEEAVERIREQVGGSRVLCALSGGVDSTVVAALLNRAIGDQAVCVFVDNGLLRRDEAAQVCRFFTEEYPVNFRFVDASERFLEALSGVVEPEQKRKTIGRLFIDVFTDEAGRLGDFRFLAQGTLYPDVIESRSAHGGPSATIKSHHNVGGLPDELGFELIEPLRELFKDEVRVLGHELGLPGRVVERQPFPGPGLAVRVIGEVTAERLRILREADVRVQEELADYDDGGEIAMSFAVLLPVRSVGVMGDERTYANVIALRIISTQDYMTCDWVRVPHHVLGRISNRIINEVRGVNRVVFDISPKPPSTIEWE
jgi:GMP synthase (glutamine-hydrolysing)